MAKKKSKTDVTVGEFKAWIAGIEDMNESDWHPNKIQWDKIRNKIDCLVEVVEEDIPNNFQQVPQYNPAWNYPQPQQTNYSLVQDVPDDLKYSDGSKPDFL